ncbi:FecR family protein [Paremcibacter congregatus]|uniref:Iron dicitrate transport regulator FecR n=1 Tax=Paremcibacter congregatus TaxID=2043170 RepID=A0A2G4YMM4_9PROT|nr:FecR domain-containing protein [Paremcibacter congregatus]PHZ83572.1 hypothetical protein CRD36_16535 [Paremcibacter congregatus]QDE28342.1 DUF4880 domain-containing protein [Paremcibacter congregatus]
MAFMMADNMTVKEQAALWIVHLSSEPPSPQDRRDFDAWLAKDPANRAEYDRARRLWAGLSGAEGLADLVDTPDIAVSDFPSEQTGAAAAQQSLHLQSVKNSGGFRRVMSAAAALFLLIMTSLLILQDTTFFSGGTVHATEISEIRDVVLPDGSRVTLGAKSMIRTDFTDTERRVTLAQGEAFFAVEKDPARPFIVTAGDTRVRVVGTKFDMRHGVGEVKVTVLEGIVEVDRVPATPSALTKQATANVSPQPSPSDPPGTEESHLRTNVLTAGQEIIAAVRGSSFIRELPSQKIGVWRSGRLVYADETLREVVADANRYYRKEIRLASTDLGELRITASFRAEQIEQMIRSLIAAYGLEADQRDGEVILRRKQANPA